MDIAPSLIHMLKAWYSSSYRLYHRLYNWAAPPKETLNVGLRFWITNDIVHQWFTSKRFFFILSMPRSGTKFLSHLLDQAPEAIVEHEPVFSDINAHRRAYFNPSHAHDYVVRFRKKDLYLRLRSRRFTVYGEVNNLLRRHYEALREYIPGTTFLHLVRDGRDVVRSMMSRGSLMPGNIYSEWVRPHATDPYHSQWETMRPFDRICWYWQAENRYLRMQIDRSVRFEDILKDYQLFRHNVLDPLQLEISEALWQKHLQRTINDTRDFNLPHWREWDASLKDAFHRICGDEMRAYGYQI